MPRLLFALTRQRLPHEPAEESNQITRAGNSRGSPLPGGPRRVAGYARRTGTGVNPERDYRPGSATPRPGLRRARGLRAVLLEGLGVATHHTIDVHAAVRPTRATRPTRPTLTTQNHR